MTDADLLPAIHTLRNEAGLVRHATRCVARAGGGDLLAWLERIASLPVADMAAGELRAITLMDGKGKLRADPRVMAIGEPSEGLLLDLPASEREAVLRLLDMYVIADDVVIEDLFGDHELVTLAGPRSAETLTAAGWELPAAGRMTVGARGAPGEHGGQRDQSGPGVLLVQSELCGGPGYDLLGPRQALEAALADLAARGVETLPREALDVLRVAAGVPWFTPDLCDGVIPLEAHLDHKVSSTKGCYPGQEVIARILNLGQVAQRLVRLVADGRVALQPGTELHDEAGRKRGALTSVVFDPTCERTLALGFVKRAAFDTGSQLLAGDDVVLRVESLLD